MSAGVIVSKAMGSVSIVVNIKVVEVPGISCGVDTVCILTISRQVYNRVEKLKVRCTIKIRCRWKYTHSTGNSR